MKIFETGSLELQKKYLLRIDLDHDEPGAPECVQLVPLGHGGETITLLRSRTDAWSMMLKGHITMEHGWQQSCLNPTQPLAEAPWGQLYWDRTGVIWFQNQQRWYFWRQEN